MKRYLVFVFLLCILPVISGCSQTAAVDQNVAKKIVVSSTNAEKTKVTSIEERTNAKIRSNENEASNAQETGKAILSAEDVREDSTAAASLNLVKENQSKLLITRDFGKQTIFEKQHTFGNKCSILDFMQANLTIETKYGGNFVGSINGLKSNGSGFSNKQNDWFYYVNGICSSVGLADYELQNGDSIWWDYHAWQMGPANAAVVGAYPEPFVHGFRGEVKPVLPDRPRPEAIKNLLDKFHLKPFRDMNPRELSTGERQRVALASMLISKPDILLLDEPARGLDYKLKEELG